MKLLVLGGTRFLGRHIVQQALAAGHEVTLLHRGQSNAGLFPEAEHRVADRNGDLSVLNAGRWDAAIDTSAYFPRQVRAVAAALAGRVGQYQLVSSISVYARFEPEGPDEGAPRATLADPTVEVITGETYGGLKALCEDAAQEAFGARCLVSRPGLIVGPHDPTGRFTWWVHRFARAAQGETVLVPGPADGPVQFIDARDLAAWHLRQAEAATGGVFNLTGPAEPLSLAGFFGALRETLAPAARLEWVDAGFLLAQGVQPWSDLPVWLGPEDAGLHRTHISRALATGLACRPLEQTLADTAAWACEAPQQGLRAGNGLPAEREMALLAAWHAARG